jgi:hypothetical protein
MIALLLRVFTVDHRRHVTGLLAEPVAASAQQH